MCRLYGFMANEKTKLECTLVKAHNSLMQQSQKDSLGRTNADGWGISYYQDEAPAIEKEGGSAFDDPRFSELATKVRSTAVIAHIRLATVGETDSRNAHPFSCGAWSFAHNGTVEGFELLKEKLVAETDPLFQLRRIGATDSEQVFYWILTRLKAAGISHESSLDDSAQSETVLNVLAESARELMRRCESVQDEEARLNFLLTDGKQMFATRWNNSLYFVRREGVRDCQVCQISHVEPNPHQTYRAVVIASEPLSDEPWQEIENGSVCHVDHQQNFQATKL